MIQCQSTLSCFSKRIKPEVPKAETMIKKSPSVKDESGSGFSELRKIKKKLKKITINDTTKTTKAW